MKQRIAPVPGDFLWSRASGSVVEACVDVVSDGFLITGQNPTSSGPTAKTLLDRLAATAA
jgi:putative intracellular protease/amidase